MITEDAAPPGIKCRIFRLKMPVFCVTLVRSSIDNVHDYLAEMPLPVVLLVPISNGTEITDCPADGREKALIGWGFL